MKIVLIRHADPDYANDTLTPLGFAEARKLGDYLQRTPLTHVYCSPLGRAQRTMEAALVGRRIEPVTLDWLREVSDVRTDYKPFLSWTVRAHHLDADPDMAAHVAECMAGQSREIIVGWDTLMAEHGYERGDGRVYHCVAPTGSPIIAVFAHGGLILTLLAALFRWPLAETYAGISYKPTAITHLKMYHTGEKAELRIRTLAALPHLEDDT